jgi:hypothetical protein
VKLTVGVTGHRDLVEDEIPALKGIVRRFFLQLQDDFPELDLQLITPLAEGADLLVTEVAQELGIDLIVPLPMAQAEYEKDFSSREAIEKFRDILRQSRVIYLQTLTDEEGRAQYPANHERQYAQLGVFISNHSQVLLTLWDGKPSTAVGGTAGVVSYHLTAVMPGYSVAGESANLLADNDNDLAYHVVCSRDRPDGQPAEGFEPLQTAWVTAHYDRDDADHMPLDYQAMLQRLHDYDRDEERYRASIERESVDLLSNAPDMKYPPGVDAICRQHGVADWLAIHFQKRVFGGLFATHCLAVFIGLVFILYSEFDGLDYLLSLFLLAFLAGFVVFKVGERRQWHRKYLDYRALAEGLRVQFYWSLAGVIDVKSAVFAYENFLQKQDVDLGWIRHVMRNVSLQRSRDQVPQEAWLDWVIEEWVGDQADNAGQLSYYRRKEIEKAKKFQRTTYLGKIALWAGILIAVILALIGQDISDFQRNWLLVLIGIFPLIAGVRDAYSHKKAEKELIKQYRFMHGVFANARRLLDSSDDPEFRRRVLRAVGNAALEESAEWILMHRERPMEHSSL